MIYHLKSGLICTLCIAVLTIPSVTHEAGNGNENPVKYTIENKQGILAVKVDRPEVKIVLGKSNEQLKEEQEEHQRQNDADMIAQINREKPIRVNPDTEAVRSKIYAMAVERWGEAEAQDVLKIVNGESGFHQFARNGNCCGLFQRLNRCTDEIMNDLDGQISEGLDYIANRYGTPSEAWSFWNCIGICRGITKKTTWY